MGLRAWLSRLGPRRSARQHENETAEVPDLAILETKLGHRFADVDLLRTALTHRSHVYRSGQERVHSNERLEFLGDSVLGLIVNEYLYEAFPERSEGDLTKVKSLVVSRAVLGRAAEGLDLGQHLILAPGEIDAGGRMRASILSDAYEAVLGALYLDGGLEPVRNFVIRDLMESLEETVTDHRLVNYKSQLQETIQAHLKSPPRYKLTATHGPDHAKRFIVEVLVRGRVLGRGEGNSKKLAEQRAAREALLHLNDDPSFLQDI